MHQVRTFDFADPGFDQLFRSILRPVRDGAVSQAKAIRLDVSETDQGYVVLAEIPGVKKEDIHVTIEGNQVTLSAEVQRDAGVSDGTRVLRNERHRGTMARSFTLPVELDEDASTAKYENGVLELTLAKKQPVAGRKLTIQ